MTRLGWLRCKTSTQTNHLVQEKKLNIEFQDGSHLGFPIRMILVTFDLLVISIVPMKFRVNCPFRSGQKVQNRFSTWLLGQPPWASDQNDFSYFWSTSQPDTSYQVSIGPFCSGEEVQNRFSRWQLWGHLIFLQNDFSYLWLTSHPDVFCQVLSQLAFLFRKRRAKQIFKIAATETILDFRSEWF